MAKDLAVSPSGKERSRSQFAGLPFAMCMAIAMSGRAVGDNIFVLMNDILFPASGQVPQH